VPCLSAARGLPQVAFGFDADPGTPVDAFLAGFEGAGARTYRLVNDDGEAQTFVPNEGALR